MASRNKLVVLGIVLFLFAAVASAAAPAPAESAEGDAPAAQPPSAAVPGEEDQEMKGLEQIDTTPPITPASTQAFCHCYCRCESQSVEACIPAGPAANCSQFNGQECSDLFPTCHIEPTLSSCVPPKLSPFDCP